MDGTAYIVSAPQLMKRLEKRDRVIQILWVTEYRGSLGTTYIDLWQFPCSVGSIHDDFAQLHIDSVIVDTTVLVHR